MVFGFNFPKLFYAEAKFWWADILCQIIFFNQLFGKRAACALTEQHIFTEQGHAALIGWTGSSVFLQAHIAGGDTNHGIIFIDQFRSGKSRINFHSKAFGLLSQPAADISQRDNVIAMIAHQAGHGEIGNGETAGFAQEDEFIICHRRFKRMALFIAPAWQECIHTNRVNDSAGNNMSADLCAFFQNDDV